MFKLKLKSLLLSIFLFFLIFYILHYSIEITNPPNFLENGSEKYVSPVIFLLVSILFPVLHELSFNFFNTNKNLKYKDTFIMEKCHCDNPSCSRQIIKSSHSIRVVGDLNNCHLVQKNRRKNIEALKKLNIKTKVF